MKIVASVLGTILAMVMVACLILGMVDSGHSKAPTPTPAPLLSDISDEVCIPIDMSFPWPV